MNLFGAFVIICTAAAVQAGPSCVGQVARVVLYVRESPALTGKLIGEFVQGSKIDMSKPVKGDDFNGKDTWFTVENPNKNSDVKIGYVTSYYVDENKGEAFGMRLYIRDEPKSNSKFNEKHYITWDKFEITGRTTGDVVRGSNEWYKVPKGFVPTYFVNVVESNNEDWCK